MTEEQKRFKITKRESYEKQISQEKKNATIKTFLTGLGSAASLFVFLAATKSSETSTRLVAEALGILGSGMSAYNLKGVIEAISKKTMLEGKVEDINTELEMLENNESRGIKR